MLPRVCLEVSQNIFATGCFIKVEDTRDENHLDKLEVSLITCANKSEKEERNSDDTLRQIRQIIKRKVKRSKKKTRQTQNKIKTLHPLQMESNLFI